MTEETLVWNGVLLNADLENHAKNKTCFKYSDLSPQIRYLYESGVINLLPIEAKTKRFAGRGWKQYQSEQFPINELKKHEGNFAIVGGCPLGAKDSFVTVIDLDDFKLWKHFKDIDTFKQKSPKKGYQLIITSDKIFDDKQYFKREYDRDIDIIGAEKFYALLSPSYVEYYKNNALIHVGSHEQLSKRDLKEGEEFFLHVKDAKKFVEDIITKAGYEKKTEDRKSVKEEVEARKEEIIKILKAACPGSGHRQDYALCIAGTLKEKAGFAEAAAEEVIRHVFDDEIGERVGAVKSTYAKNTQKLQGWGYLQKYFNKFQRDGFLDAINNNSKNLKDKITDKLLKNKYPSFKELTDYLSLNLGIFKNLDTLKYYEKQEDDSLVEIDSKRIVKYFNDEFGADMISQDLCDKALGGITNPIEKDYNLIEFSNGVLNTKTHEFIEDKSFLCKVPKMSIPFKWNPEAKGGLIETVINETLDNEEYLQDKELWFRAVGHMFMGINRIGKHVIVEGPSKSGKSTLSTLLKRIFNYSEIPILDICKNERFTLYSMIDKDVNIDDDINNGVLKGIGFLNSVTTGNSLEVEVKHEKARVKAENSQIPRLYSNGNSLPPVVGEGFQTRLLLIHAVNVKPADERKDDLQPAIMLGEYDNELEWLVYAAITSYWDNIDKPMTGTQKEEEMHVAYEMKSNPVRVSVQELFEEDWNEDSSIKTKDAHNLVKRWLKIRYKQGKVSKEHAKAGQVYIGKEMDKAGYFKKQKSIYEDGDRTTVEEYEDIQLTELGKQIKEKITPSDLNKDPQSTLEPKE